MQYILTEEEYMALKGVEKFSGAAELREIKDRFKNAKGDVSAISRQVADTYLVGDIVTSYEVRLRGDIAMEVIKLIGLRVDIDGKGIEWK